jgi:hypothetical protein
MESIVHLVSRSLGRTTGRKTPAATWHGGEQRYGPSTPEKRGTNHL